MLNVEWFFFSKFSFSNELKISIQTKENKTFRATFNLMGGKNAKNLPKLVTKYSYTMNMIIKCYTKNYRICFEKLLHDNN